MNQPGVYHRAMISDDEYEATLSRAVNKLAGLIDAFNISSDDAEVCEAQTEILSTVTRLESAVMLHVAAANLHKYMPKGDPDEDSDTRPEGLLGGLQDMQSQD